MILKLLQISLNSVLLTLAILSSSSAHASPFVTRNGNSFILNGAKFAYSGTNNYYLIYKSKKMVDDVMNSAQQMNLKVIRTWGFLDTGLLNGAQSVDSPKDGVYFQYWNPATASPAYNDGANGLERLDYVVYAAKQKGLKLIIPFVNNWREFGGIDQYVTWYGLSYHDDFYRDARTRQAYKNWVSHLLNRKNIYTGVLYKDEPTIMAWELANEPRCKGSGNKPTSSNCNTTTLLNWVKEMSSFVKQNAPKQLVGVGDEGFFARQSSDWMYNGSEGVDFDAFIRVPTIDFGTFHLYPDAWGRSYDWGNQWITEHLTAGTQAGKPVILEEFGAKDQTNRSSIYQKWLDTVCKNQGAGDNVWMLAAKQDDGNLYPDYDGFTIYFPSAIATVITTHANRMISSQCLATPTPIPTTKPTPAPTPVPTPTPTPIPSGSIKVRTEAALGNFGSNQETQFKLRLHNDGTKTLGGLKARVFLNLSEIYSAGLSVNQVTTDKFWDQCGVVSISPLKSWKGSSSNFYVDLDWSSFNFLANKSCEVHFRVRMSNWQTVWNATNDYSYQGLTGSMASTLRIPIYQNGVKVYGSEP